MERLGIYIIYFFIIGLAFFERVRTRGETGNIWRLLLRNAFVSVIAFLGIFFLGYDLMVNSFSNWQPLQLFNNFLNHPNSDDRFKAFDDAWLACVKCVAASVLVSAGIWELRFSKWYKWIILLTFSLLIYPLFGSILEGEGPFSLQTFNEQGDILNKGIYDHAKVLLVWALPAAFILGCRLLMPGEVLPIERRHDLKGVKVLPGMKHRFLLSRGIGFIMIFLVLNTPSLIHLFPDSNLQGKTLWVISKTILLLPASFVILFSSILFFGLFGKNNLERTSYAPPFFAIMAVLVSSQACNQYDFRQTLLVSVLTTFTALLFLRIVPLSKRIWDPACSIAIFLFGSYAGILAATLTTSADLSTQTKGILASLLMGIVSGGFITLMLRKLGCLKPGQNDLVPDLIEDKLELKEEAPAEEIKSTKKKKLRLFKRKPRKS